MKGHDNERSPASPKTTTTATTTENKLRMSCPSQPGQWMQFCVVVRMFMREARKYRDIRQGKLNIMFTVVGRVVRGEWWQREVTSWGLRFKQSIMVCALEGVKWKGKEPFRQLGAESIHDRVIFLLAEIPLPEGPTAKEMGVPIAAGRR